MAKVPMMIMVDPAVETQFTIKPFAAGLATKAPSPADPGELERGTSFSGSGTGIGGSTGADVDADVDLQ